MTNLKTIENLQYLNTENVKDMSSMFESCFNLTSLDLSNFDTSNVTDMTNMFASCGDNLVSLDLSTFDTSNVTSMYGMFDGCPFTSLDLSNFDTSNVTSMENMFNFCSALTSLDVSSFDVSSVTDMSSMFENCANLETIYCNNNWQKNGFTSDNMFSGCSKLSGKFEDNEFEFNDSNPTDATYAKAFNGTDGGYFTPVVCAYAVAEITGETGGVPEASLTFYYDNRKLTYPSENVFDIPWIGRPDWVVYNICLVINQTLIQSLYACSIQSRESVDNRPI